MPCFRHHNLQSRRYHFLSGWHAAGRYPVTPVRYIGRVVLGHAPDGNSPWTGAILGLAVYDHAITAGEIAQHYGIWRSQKPWLLQSARALYTFDERTGNVVHNRTGPAPDLLIPANFKPLNISVLAVPHPFRFRIDTVVNVLGFMPFGFVLCAYLQGATFLGGLSWNGGSWTYSTGTNVLSGVGTCKLEFNPIPDSCITPLDQGTILH